MEWKFRRKTTLLLGCLLFFTFCQKAVQGECTDFPTFPDITTIFKQSLQLEEFAEFAEMFDTIKAENENCACNIKHAEDGYLSSFNTRLENDALEECEVIDVESTCIDTTEAPTTEMMTTLGEDTTTVEETTLPPAPITTPELDQPETSSPVHIPTTVIITQRPPYVETSSSLADGATTSSAGAPSTQSSPLPIPPVTGPSTDGEEDGQDSSSTGVDANTTAPVPAPVKSSSRKDMVPIYAGVAGAVVFILIVVVVLLFVCRTRFSACAGALVSQDQHDKLRRQRSDCQPISADLQEDTYSQPTTPETPDVAINGTFGRSNGYLVNGKDHVDAVSFKPKPENNKYVILREDSTASTNDFHFNTLKAMEFPHALQHGDFGETSTDQTLPRNRDRMAETSLNMDPKCNTFKNSKKKRNGSDSGVEISPTLKTKGTDTMKSKPEIAYITYENPCIRDEDFDNKSTKTADTQSVCTLDSKDEAALQEWKDWVDNELSTDPKSTEDGEDLISAKNAHLFFPPTPDDSPPRTKQNSFSEDSPELDRKSGDLPVKSDINSNVIYPHAYDNKAMLGSDEYLAKLPEQSSPATDTTPSDTKTPLDDKAMLGSNSYVNKLPTQKPVAQIEPLMQNGLPVNSKPEVKPRPQPQPQPVSVPPAERSPAQSVPHSTTTSNSSLNKVGLVAPPLEFSDNQQRDAVFSEPEPPAPVHGQPVKPAKPAMVRVPEAEEEGEGEETNGIKPRRLSVKDLRAQFEGQEPGNDHQSTLRKYGSKPRSQSARQETPAVATLPRGKPSKTFPNKHVFGKKPLDPIPASEESTQGGVPPKSAPPGRTNFLWADKQVNGPSA